MFLQKNLHKNLKNFGTNNICAMVKANAYGVGVEKVCKALANRVRFFGVANINEALEIRFFDKTTKILVVGLSDDFETALENNIDITVDSVDCLEKIRAFLNAKKPQKKLRVHIKINTGMNRLGVKKKTEFLQMLRIIQKTPKIALIGVFTHFSTIQNDKKFLQKQGRIFEAFLKVIPPIFNPIIHIGGGAILKKLDVKNRPKIMVRVGLELYKNVFEIYANIIKIHDIKKGERVGYANGFIAKENRKIAVVPLGYADGINRRLANAGMVEILEQKCKIVGNVCMDMFFVDITNTTAKVGDNVKVFWSADKWAKICDTSPYEILTNLRL